MIDNIKVGKTIAILRQDRGMTQQQLAAAVNVSHQAVSKWENGAALPDIQTMLSLTRLFGITVEQLIEGEIPVEEEEDRPQPGKTLDDHLHNIGSFVTNVVDGIFRPNSEKKSAPINEESEEPESAPEDEYDEPDVQPQKEEIFDVQKLLKMAPFMSKGALDSILLENRAKLTPDDISKFAPFVSKGTLEKLIQNSEGEINWDVLQRIAPFLKREMVDALARAAATGERMVRKAVQKTERSASEFEKSIGDVSQKIGAGMGKVAKQAMKFGEEIVDGLSAAFCDQGGEKPRVSRAQSLRLAALERAMSDGRWEWIAAHLSDVQDDVVRSHIAQVAMDQGMMDWLKANLPEYAQINEAEVALEADDWDGVSAHLDHVDAGYQARAALKAASENNWNWLSANADRLRFGENASKIVMLAYESNMQDTAIAIAETQMVGQDVENFMNSVVEKGDYGFAAQLSHLVSSEFLENICNALAQDGKWMQTAEFLPLIESDGIERLMDLAISQGDFAAIDLLDDYLEI